MREVTPPPSSTYSISTGDEETSTLEHSGTLVTTSLGDAVWRWGKVTNLRGLISSFSVFNDTLNATSFMVLHNKGGCGQRSPLFLHLPSPPTGPNDLSLYQYKCADTYELGSKLILYYNARVSGEISVLHAYVHV